MNVTPAEFVILMIAWFLQMGLHEGGHAIVADRLGDHLPRMMGKVTVNPFKIIDWNNPSFVISAVVIPAVTAAQFGFPMGMAWVMVSHMSSKKRAFVAIAGPIGSFVAAIIAYAVILSAFPLVIQNNMLVYALNAIIYVSLLYALFNLVPWPGIDGGDVLYHFLPDEARHKFDMMRPYGFIILFVGLFLLSHLTNGQISLGRALSFVATNAIEFVMKSGMTLWR